MGIEIDHGRNAANDPIVSCGFARTTVVVIATDEQPVIARGARAAGRSGQETA